MRKSMIWAAAGTAVLATSAMAGSVGGDVALGLLPTNDTASAQLNHFNNLPFALPAVAAQSGVTGVSGTVLTFGSIGTGEVGSALGNFYLGTAQNLENAQGGVWFNTVGNGSNAAGLANIGTETLVLGFGNNARAGSNFSDNVVTISFNPGVQGFIFNFADIGDVSGTELEVTWSDGSTTEDVLTTSNDPTGYVSLIAEAGKTISSLTLTQNLDSNDGFLFYGFSTLTVVPLPPAAWAGLAMLGGLAGVRKLRRRG